MELQIAGNVGVQHRQTIAINLIDDLRHESETGILDQLAPIFRSYLHGYGIDQSLEAAVNLLRSLLMQEWVVINVAIDVEKVVSFSILTKTYSSIDCKLSLELKDMYVVPSSRKSGIGTSMLSFILEQCKSLGLDSVFIYADSDTKTFYSKMGWRELEHVILKKNVL